MLARLQRGDAHPAVIRDRRIDMHRVHLRVLQQFLEIRVSHRHTERIADGVQLLRVALADGIHVRIRMPLVERDELRSETKADDGDIDAIFFRHEGNEGAAGGLRRGVKPPHARGVKAFATELRSCIRAARVGNRGLLIGAARRVAQSRSITAEGFPQGFRLLSAAHPASTTLPSQ